MDAPKERIGLTTMLSLVSSLVALVFIVLALGSYTIEDLLSTDLDINHEVLETWEHKTEISFQGKHLISKSGYQDKYGRWQGTVYTDIYFVETGEQMCAATAGFRNGQYHGKAEVVRFHGYGHQTKFTYHYKDGKCIHHEWYTEKVDTKSAKSGISGFGVFQHSYPMNEFLFHAMGYDSIYLATYFSDLETELNAAPFGPEEFDDRYEEAVEALEQTPYDSIINDNESLTYLNSYEHVKDHPFRLAVIDSYLEQEDQILHMLESRYPGYVALLAEEAELALSDFSEFCREFDSCMASYGTLSLEDLYLIDSINVRIYRALFAIYNAGEEDAMEDRVRLALHSAGSEKSSMHFIRRVLASVEEKTMGGMDPPEVAEIVLYTIVMTYLEGDLIKQALWEAWARSNGIPAAPEVGTGDLKGLTSTSVSLGGHVFYNGGEALTGKGVVWGASYDPTTDMNSLNSSSASDSFEVVISGLVESRQYYARAYATNSMGTAYGSTVSFVAEELSGIEKRPHFDTELSIYPNPVSECLNLRFTLEQAARVEVQVCGMDGRRVYHQEHGLLSQGSSLLEIDVSFLEEGTYVCLIMEGETLLGRSKLVVAR